jgi:GAF domain-containing protein
LPDEISLVRLLNELVRTPLTDLDKAVSQAIGRLCTHIGAGWGSLFRLDGAYLITTHSYVAPGLPSLSCPPAYMLGAGRVVLEQNEPLLIADLAVLPADSPLRAQVWAKSLLALPINGDTGLIGVLAFAFPET